MKKKIRKSKNKMRKIKNRMRGENEEILVKIRKFR